MQNILGKVVRVKATHGHMVIFPVGTIGRVIEDEGGSHVTVGATGQTLDEAGIHRDDLEVIDLPVATDDVIERLCGLVVELRFQLEQTRARHHEATAIIEQMREGTYLKEGETK